MRVAAPDDLSRSPAVLVTELCDLLGAVEVARWCADLLSGKAAYDDPARPFVTWLGGGPAAAQLQRGNLIARQQDYWPRVWAARGLLYAWDQEVAATDVVRALGDESWRVREMAAKVVARRKLNEATKRLSELVADPNPRVRAAATRARAAVGTSVHDIVVRSDPQEEGTQARGRKPRRPAGGGPAKAAAGKESTPSSKAAPVALQNRAKVTAGDLDKTIAGAMSALRAGADRDWSVAAHGLQWSCARTAGHVADDLIAYAAQLAGGVRTGYLPFTFAPKRRTGPAGLLNLIEASGALLSTVVRAAPASARAYHPYGLADAEGFAALGVAEVLVHTHDIATGLGLSYDPPSRALCTRIKDRLDPELEPYEDPWTLLLWSTGRVDIPGRERVRRWHWQPGAWREDPSLR